MDRVVGNLQVEEMGRVVKVDGDIAEVEVVPAGGCSHCGAKNLCNWTGQQTRRIFAINRIKAAIGDNVTIVRDIRQSTYSALLVFGVPVGMTVIGILSGSLFLKSDRWATALAGLGILSGVAIVKLIDKKRAESKAGLPVIVRLSSQKGVDNVANNLNDNYFNNSGDR